jgi:hypothetical protein
VEIFEKILARVKEHYLKEILEQDLNTEIKKFDTIDRRNKINITEPIID